MAFLKTRLGKILTVFVLGGLLGVASFLGCEPCADLLKPLIPVAEQPVAE